MKKEGIQTRKRKPKNLNKTKSGMKLSSYTVGLKEGVETFSQVSQGLVYIWSGQYRYFMEW